MANHSSWWDAIVPVVLSLHVLRLDAMGVMEEAQLSNVAFFRRLGFRGIDRGNPRKALADLASVAAEMSAGKALWYFPQGKIVPVDRRPLEFERGIDRLLERMDRPFICPIALRYEIIRTERPVAYIRIGKPMPAPDSERIGQLQGMLLRELEQLRLDFTRNECSDYRVIFSGKQSINERWNRIRRIGRTE